MCTIEHMLLSSGNVIKFNVNELSCITVDKLNYIIIKVGLLTLVYSNGFAEIVAELFPPLFKVVTSLTLIFVFISRYYVVAKCNICHNALTTKS